MSNILLNEDGNPVIKGFEDLNYHEYVIYSRTKTEAAYDPIARFIRKEDAVDYMLYLLSQGHDVEIQHDNYIDWDYVFEGEEDDE